MSKSNTKKSGLSPFAWFVIVVLIAACMIAILDSMKIISVKDILNSGKKQNVKNDTTSTITLTSSTDVIPKTPISDATLTKEVTTANPIPVPSTNPNIGSPVPSQPISSSSVSDITASTSVTNSTTNYIKLKNTWSDENKDKFSPGYACNTSGKIDVDNLEKAKQYCENCGADCYAVTRDESGNYSVRQGGVDEFGNSDEGESSWYMLDKPKPKPVLPAAPKIVLKMKWSDEKSNTYSEGNICGNNGLLDTGDLDQAKKLCEDCKDCNAVTKDGTKYYARKGKMKEAKSSSNGESTWFNLGDPNAPPEVELPPVIMDLLYNWSDANPDKYSGDIACDSKVYTSELEAKYNCEKCTDCNAITSDMDSTAFTMRKNKDLQDSENGEISWIKQNKK